MTESELQGYVQIAEVLISLGLTTATKIESFFSGSVSDADLTAILGQTKVRLARRGISS